MERVDFDTALARTINKNRCCGNMFQRLIIICAITSIMTGFVILGGISFLEKIPNKFECKSDSLEVIILRNENMTHTEVQNIETDDRIQSFGDWKQCSQTYICKNNLNLYKDLYRYDEKDPEYIDNWIQKFDLLCKPTEYIGLIGSCYMVGMFIGFFILPPYSDTYGRRPIFILTMILSSIAQGIILQTTSIHKLFLFMIILGTTFSGKNIVSLNYAVESVPKESKELVVSLYWIVELVSIILWSFYYQKLDKNWYPLQFIYFLAGIFVTLLGIVFFPESPTYLHNKQKFDEARESMAYIAKFNGSTEYSSNFLFDDEIESEESQERRRRLETSNEESKEPEAQNLIESQIQVTGSKNENDNVVLFHQMSEGQLFTNLIKMTIMWLQGSFNQFLLSAQMKYLEGNIFVNFYIFGIAGIIAVLAGGILLSRSGLKTTYYISNIFAIIGSAAIIIIQGQFIPFKTIIQKEYFEEKSMPILILILKLGIIMNFITTTQISFTDDRIFPPNRRNTSVGTCGMIARSITILAPIVNEWAAPIPIVIILVLSVIGLATSTTFPSSQEKIKSEIYNQKEESGSQITYQDLSQNLEKNSNEEEELDFKIEEQLQQRDIKSTGHTTTQSLPMKKFL